MLPSKHKNSYYHCMYVYMIVLKVSRVIIIMWLCTPDSPPPPQPPASSLMGHLAARPHATTQCIIDVIQL